MADCGIPKRGIHGQRSRGGTPRRDERGATPRRDERGGTPRRDERGAMPRRDERGGTPRRDEMSYSTMSRSTNSTASGNTSNSQKSVDKNAGEISGTPSPIGGKRYLQLPVINQGRPPLMKRQKYEKEVTLHVLLPNATSFKCTADSARIHSIEALKDLVKKKAFDFQHDTELESSSISLTPRKVEWGPKVLFEDHTGNQLSTESVVKAMSEAKMGSIITLLVQDGEEFSSHMDRNMWNVTPKPEMLGQLPQGYTLKTALADQVDNALQAVWHNNKDRRLVSVKLNRDKITIFDTGQGMDGSTENCIANWGTVGGSTHRAVHHKALGGKPPFLKVRVTTNGMSTASDFAFTMDIKRPAPYLGKYGAGGVAAALHLGGCVTVWSKTRKSKKVVSLGLEGKALVERHKENPEQRVWRTTGEFRDMTKEEKEMSPHGSFTRVEISKLKQQYSLEDNDEVDRQQWEVSNVRQLLKDIYFPYIQSEEEASSKTIYPVEFEVNGTNLLEVTECETAISKWHTCNGDPFVIDICMKRPMDEIVREKGRGASNTADRMEVANARITCHYYPNHKGKESLETVIEGVEALKGHKPSNSMTFENMNRVAIRWLARLLPEVNWSVFPFMEVPPKRDQKSGLRLWAKRVKAFVDTDGGFNPNQSKTELERDQPFVVALRQIGSEILAGTSAFGVVASIKQNGRDLSNSQLKDMYIQWLMDMHANFDEEFAFVDKATFVFNYESSFKELGMGNKSYLMFQKHMKESKQEWKIDDQNPTWMKLQRGPGLKSDKYVTLEYFFHDGAEDDHGLQVKFLCRDIAVDAADGCKITVHDENARIELKSSECFPASLLSTAKRLDIVAWKKKKEELLNKSPGRIEFLNEQDAKTFDVCEVFPDHDSRFEAGFSLPKEFLVVVRPRKGSGLTCKQGMIVAEPLAIKLTVTHCTCSGVKVCRKRRSSVSSGDVSSSHTHNDHTRVVCSLIAKNTVKNGVKGLYMFSTESSEASCLVTEGIYTFQFALESEKYKEVDPAVSSIKIFPSKTTKKWTLCNHSDPCMITDHDDTRDNMETPVIRLNEQLKEDLFLQKYDEYGNCQKFQAPLALEVTCVTPTAESLQMDTKVQSSMEGDKRLKVKDILFTNGVLEGVGPKHEALLRVRVRVTGKQVAEMRCKVFPGELAAVEVESSEPLISAETMCFEEPLQPGEIIKNLTLQGLDSCGNKIEKGQEMQVLLDGLACQDSCDNNRVCDENGTLQLGGLLKVDHHYNSTGSITICSSNGLKICTIGFETLRRKLVATQVPSRSFVGRELEGISVTIVDESGNVDTSVDGYNHSITVDWLETVTYPFTNGECTLPPFKLPEKPGLWKGKVSFSANTSLSVTLMVELELATACTIGPARKKTETLTAECGVPFVLLFTACDDHQNPGLLTESMIQNISVTGEGRDFGHETAPLCKPLKVECKAVRMTKMRDTVGYAADIVVSGCVGTYKITLADTSSNLKGKVESLCKLKHGTIAKLVLTQPDRTHFLGFEDSASGPIPIIEATRCSPMPTITAILRDAEDNVCISCEHRKLRMRIVDCIQWKVLVTDVLVGIGKFESSSVVVPVGRYQVSVELDKSPEELYSLNEQSGRLKAHFSLRVNHGNYPSSLRLLSPNEVYVSLTGESIQYLPPINVLVESADGRRLRCRPTVGIKLHGDSFSASGPVEYFGTFMDSSDRKMDIRVKQEGDVSSGPIRYEFTQVCAPSKAGNYVMEYFVRGSDVPPICQQLVVHHGPPSRMEIVQIGSGQEIDVLQVHLVDAHGNKCDDVSGLELSLELALSKDVALTLGLNPCEILSQRTSVVERGHGDFGVFQVTKGTIGMYTLKIFPTDGEEDIHLRALIPVEAEISVTRGDVTYSFQQLINKLQEFQAIEGYSNSRVSKCEHEIEQKNGTWKSLEKEQREIEEKIQILNGKKNKFKALQRAANDAQILEAEEREPQRGEQTVMDEIARLAYHGNSAAMIFLEARSGTNFLSPHWQDPAARDFVGLVVMLARFENDSLNRIIAEYMGSSTLLLIVSRTQLAVGALEQYDAHGNIDESKGLHGFARDRGFKAPGNFDILTMTDTRPYKRAHGPTVNFEHPQRILNIDPPVLPGTDGQVPRGFLGYAVNLLYLTSEGLQTRVPTRLPGEFGLRESLFFHLLGALQVYDTRQNMVFAKERLNKFQGGAISLDGGLIRKNQRQQLGRRRENLPVRFGTVPLSERETVSLIPPACYMFQRLWIVSTIDSEIRVLRDALSSLRPTMDATLAQIKKLKKDLGHAKKQQQETDDSSKLVRKQIGELKRAEAVIEARKSTGTEIVKYQGGDRMRSFMTKIIGVR